MTNSHSGRNLVRAQVSTPPLYQVLNIVFGVLFSGILLITLFNTRYTLIQYTWYWQLLCILAGLALFYALYRLVRLLPDFDRPIESAIVAMLFVAFIGLQFYIGWTLRVNPTTDTEFGTVYTYAQEYVLHGTLPDEYFLHFPHNSSLYLFWVGFMSVFKQMGLRDFATAAMLLNVVSIDLAIYFLYRCARLLFGLHHAILAMLLAFLTTPFLLYPPVYCAETLALAFPIGAVFLWLKTRREWRAGELGAVYRNFCILSLLLGLGALFKASILIVWLAIALDLLLYLNGKGRLRVALAGLGCVALAYAGCTWLAYNSRALPEYEYSLGVPFVYWIMVGLRGNGGQYAPDFQWTMAVSSDKAGRFTAVMDEINARLADYGFGGMLGHIADKLVYTFGDGKYDVSNNLSHGVVSQGRLHELVVGGGKWFDFTVCYAFAVQAASIVGAVLSAVRSFLSKNDCITFVRVALFGLVVFLLVWETQPQYLVPFLPLLLLCAVEAFPMKQLRRSARKASMKNAPVRKRKRVEKRTDAAATVVAKPRKSDGKARKSAPVQEQGGFLATPLEDGEKRQRLAGGKPVPILAEELENVPPQGDPFFDIARTMQVELAELQKQMDEKRDGKDV